MTGSPTLVALRPARLFDGTSASLLPGATVLVAGERIAAVLPPGAAPPPDARVVDLPGTTMLPGLVDAHVHLAFDAGPAPVAALAERDDAALDAAMRAAARTALLGGVTTVRDLGDRGYHSLTLRGEPELPRILAAGPPLTTPGGHCHYLGGAVPDGADAVRAAVRDRAARGCDVVKIMGSGGNLTPGTRPESSQFSPATVRAAVDEAHRLGLPVAVHAHGTGAIESALDAGADSIEHASFWTADGVAEPGPLADRLAGSTTTVGVTVGMLASSGPPEPAVAARLPAIVATMRRLHAAGARFSPGSDAGIGPHKPHDALRHAPRAFVAAGFPAAEALRLVTSAPADAIGLSGRVGRVAAGHDADLLVVAGDPLQDLGVLHDVVAVFRLGRRVR